MLFSERCAGCHTLYAAGTHGSAPNIRTAQAISGPNFNVRCERPITRVLYAIANGGFSGAYMPQNMVVGQDAIDVASSLRPTPAAKAPKQAGGGAAQKADRHPAARPERTRGHGGSSTSGAVTSRRGARPPARSGRRPGNRAAGAADRPRSEPAMLDIRLIRREPEAVRAALARRGPAAAQMVDTLLELDERWRGVTTELEQLRSEQNAASKALRGAPSAEQREQLAELAARGRALSDAETRCAPSATRRCGRCRICRSDDAPAVDTVLREVGDATKTGRDHLELAGERIDMERGARLSGSRFAYLRGELVLLELALVNYAMRKLVGRGL